MSKSLLLYDLKSNKYLILAFTAILLLYTIIAVVMFDPEEAYMMESLLAMLPEGMVQAFGFEGLGTELTKYLAGYLYGFIYLLFPGILTVILGNTIMTKHIDSGSMAYLLTTPNSRIKIAVTQVVFFVSALLIVFAINVGIAIIMSEIMFAGHLNISTYLMLNAITFSVATFTASIVFLISCICNESRKMLGLSGSLPILFFVFNAIRNIDENLSFLKYFTIFSVVDIERIFDGSMYAFNTSVLIYIISFLIFSSSVYIFNRRSLII